MREYDQIATWYAAARSPEAGLSDLDAFCRPLPPGARVLDLGCGTGVPVSRHLVGAGFDVVALDSSAEMVARYRTLLPGVEIRHESAQDTRFAPASLDAVVAWGVLFHLSPADQRAVLGRVSDWLRPGGRLLFTSAARAGTTTSAMDGVSFTYHSLGADGYREALADAGMRLEAHYGNEWDNEVYVADKPDHPFAPGPGHARA